LQTQRAYIGNTLRGKNGLHTFGNNSTESELIWMKSGTLCAKCGGHTVTDFRRDPHSRGIVYPKKTQKLLTKFPGVATLGYHNFAMVTEIHGQMVPLRDI